MSEDPDNITLTTGKKYAFGQVVGISLEDGDVSIYQGFDGVIGETDDGLTVAEAKEIGFLMVTRWLEFIKGLQ